jgi:hypothetical protein
MQQLRLPQFEDARVVAKKIWLYPFWAGVCIQGIMPCYLVYRVPFSAENIHL